MVFMIPRIVGNYLFSINHVLYIFFRDGNDLVSSEEVRERVGSGKSQCGKDMKEIGLAWWMDHWTWI